MLSEKEVSQFQEEGFLVINDGLSMDEVEALREAAASPEFMSEAEELGYHEKTVHMLNVTTKHPAFLKLAKESRITDRVADLIGPDLQLHHSKLATKPPVKGKGGLFWHQDLAFFPHTNADLVAVMVMLDDTTTENGCMQMVRGSHKLGLLNHSRDGYFAYTCEEEGQWAHESKIAEITPNAGGISIHHCMSLHTSHRNTSGRPRRGIVYQYRAADAYQLADNLWQDGGLQGSRQAKSDGSL